MDESTTNDARSRMTGPRATAVLLAAGVAGVVVAPGIADARNHSVGTWRGTHYLSAGGVASNNSNGTENWHGLSLQEAPIPMTWMSVCDYQGAFVISNPDGSFFKTNKTSTHEGCSMAGSFESTASAGTYPENKRFTAKWISSSAQVGNEWRTIGTLVD